ncbi:hypothetical protein LPJ77_007126 [Coemansia sp. RSA 2523]|nr:hypothetical protein LPJ58_007303 [Coemansia sp. RSA 1591]KAJ1744537.1 hypothetical protein LPJ69_007323 [Coemansia sp. RSA 1752]KAJ1754024.1 hypothetical protein LPJ54_007330 [Coemansia sp. RSA 1824]KAJ1769117.1 hypothetical protein LPJ67_007154 [Coemansia sp. RSA 1938]KAJ1794072.1 hypothetical protein LPJ77_007188 [Coemansia sp. RSA 2523]KAJ2144532.1 hypothetical protein IW142_003084 [Coemansia sp. RSA 564]KAJ2166426.1 hypothetical protein GGH15_002759 [Coemansia sp. RSA 562]KAJ2175629.
MSTNAKQLELKDILEISSSGKLGDKDMVILDVRRPDEFGSGHVKNAKNVPVQELGQALQLTPSEFEAKYGFKLPANDSQTGVAVHCMRGTRAQMAASLLAEADYKDNLYVYLPGWTELASAADAQIETL